MDIVAAVNHWVHLVAAVFWIGSLAFVVMILHPSLKGKFPREPLLALTQGIQDRYIRIAGALFALVVVTGGFNFRVVRRAHLDEGGLSTIWYLFFGLKLTLATGLFSIFLLNLLYRNEPVGEEQTEIPWARSSLILGVLIVMMAAFLKHSHSL